MTKKIEVFASESLPGELEDFPDIKRGWGTTKESTGGIPPMKWFNAIQKRTDEAINSIAGYCIGGYSFTDGATLESMNDFIYDDISKSWYFWIGDFPKVINPGDEPVGDNWSQIGGDNSELLNKGIMTSSQLGIKTGEQLVAELKKREKVAVDSTIRISSHIKLPQWSQVINAGGRLDIVSTDGMIEVLPNCDHYLNVYCNEATPSKSAIYFDGKLDAPRWYVGEHRTKVTALIRSSKRDGTACLLDGVSTTDKRALISGIELDLTVQKFNIACHIKTDNSLFSGAGNAYITSNRINIISGASNSALFEEYSTGLIKPSNEEIGGSIYYVEHQPIEVDHKTIQSVGRLSKYTLNLWDNHAATNDDQVVISGNDNLFEGANLPSANSKYVKITGERNTYHGMTYGTPLLLVDSIAVGRSIYYRNNNNRYPSVYTLFNSSNPFSVKGDSEGSGTVIFSKTLKDIVYRSPLTIDVKSCFSSSSPESNVNIVIYINNHKLTSLSSGKIIEFNAMISLSEYQSNITTSTNGTRLFNTFDGIPKESELTIKMIAYGDKTGEIAKSVYQNAIMNMGSV